MRPARLMLLSVAVLLALVASAGATAVRPPPVEDGTLSVRDGRAAMRLRMAGGVIGRFARGKLTVVESAKNTTSVVVRGGRRPRSLNARTTVYQGTNVRFRIADDTKFLVKIQASKINLSAVGRGDGWLDGWGDPEAGIYFDGSFSLNGEEYKSIPDERSPIELAAPPTAG